LVMPDGFWPRRLSTEECWTIWSFKAEQYHP